MAQQKRASVTINESLIQGMIDGKTSGSENLSEGDIVEAAPEPAETPPPTGTTEIARSRKRKEPKDYRGLFLTKRAAETKRQTYVSAALFNKITEIMAVIAYDVSLPNFLDNVLEHHLEAFKDEINELYEIKTTKKPLQ